MLLSEIALDKSSRLLEGKTPLSDLRYGKLKQDAHLIDKPVKHFNPKWQEIELPQPPKNESPKTQKELEVILDYLDANSAEDLNKIKKQDVPDIELLFVDLLQKKDVEINKQLVKKISKVSKELSTISLKHKVKYDRARPYQLLKSMKDRTIPKGNTTGSPSYPSTHAVIGTFMAKWLSKLYPKHKKDLAKLGKELGDYRVKAGFHYPSDRDAGDYLANELLKMFIEND